MSSTFVESHLIKFVGLKLIALLLIQSCSQAVPESQSDSNSSDPDQITVSINDSDKILVTNSVNLVYKNIPKDAHSYCILENLTDNSNCVWVTGSLPEVYESESGDGEKVLYIWTRGTSKEISKRSSTERFVIDTAAPTWTAAGLSHAASYNSITQSPSISFNLDAVDATTDVTYEYAIGTGSGVSNRANIKSWTAVTSSPFQVSGLSLVDGTTYYVSMRAIDEARNISTVHTSSGWAANLTSSPSISYAGATGTSGTRGASMSISPSSLNAGSGATVTNCAVTAGGSLPTGLSLNASTCVISGTPSVVHASSSFTITVTNSFTNTSTASVSIEVSENWTDDSNVSLGFAGASKVGLSWSTDRVSIAADTDCDGNVSEGEGTYTNCTELDASWTPEWANLVGYWKFNEITWNGSAGEVLDSKNSNHGQSFNGAATTVSPTKMGRSSGSFDGTNDYVAIPLDLSATNKVTVAFWLNWTSFSNDNDLALEFTPDVNSSTDGFLINPNGGVPTAGYFQASLRGNVEWDVTYFTRPSAGTWHHIVYIFDKSRSSNEISAYINGVPADLVTERTADNTNNFGNSTLYVMSRGGSSLFGNGKMDDLAIWSTDLSAEEIQLIYKNQAPLYTGKITSRVFDAAAANAWSGLKWLSTLPFGKELPGDADNSGTITTADSETSTEYSGIPTDTLMNNLKALWHFNGTRGTLTDGASLSDSSGAGSSVTVQDADASNNINLNYGKLEEGLVFDGVNDYASASLNLSSTNAVSIAFWMKWDSFTNNDDLAMEFTSDYNATATGFFIDPNSGSPALGEFQFGLRGDQGYNTARFTRPSAGVWHHYVFIFDKSRAGGECSVYVNGVEQSINQIQNLDNTNNFGNSTLYFMSRAGTALFGKGALDEVAVWSRVLSEDEILSVYRRAANKTKFQVRGCSNSDCSDNPSWVGADGTNQSYFSEIHNNTSVSASGAPSGRVKVNFTDLIFFDFSGVTAPNSRYFQYRALLESDGLCDIDSDGSADDFCSPDVKSVEVVP